MLQSVSTRIICKEEAKMTVLNSCNAHDEKRVECINYFANGNEVAFNLVINELNNLSLEASVAA